MVYAFAAKSGKKPTWFELKHAIMRNFGGLDNVDSVDIFRQCLKRSTVIMDEKVVYFHHLMNFLQLHSITFVQDHKCILYRFRPGNFE